MFRNVKQ